MTSQQHIVYCLKAQTSVEGNEHTYDYEVTRYVLPKAELTLSQMQTIVGGYIQCPGSDLTKYYDLSKGVGVVVNEDARYFDLAYPLPTMSGLSVHGLSEDFLRNHFTSLYGPVLFTGERFCKEDGVVNTALTEKQIEDLEFRFLCKHQPITAELKLDLNGAVVSEKILENVE